jgi:putrescine transport system substrate-binding protein
MLRPDVAAANASQSRYATANAAAWPLMSADLLENPAVFPDAALGHSVPGENR